MPFEISLVTKCYKLYNWENYIFVFALAACSPGYSLNVNGNENCKCDKVTNYSGKNVDNELIMMIDLRTIIVEIHLLQYVVSLRHKLIKQCSRNSLD